MLLVPRKAATQSHGKHHSKQLNRVLEKDFTGIYLQSTDKNTNSDDHVQVAVDGFVDSVGTSLKKNFVGSKDY